MTVLNVSGTFPAFHDLPTLSLSGTIDITGDAITAANLAVPGFETFTHIYQSDPTAGGWILGLDDAGMEMLTVGGTTYASLGPFLLLQWNSRGGIDFGHLEVGEPSGTTYYGIGLTGTVCPLTGCPQPLSIDGTIDHWPIAAVPAPVMGAGLPVLLLAVLLVILGRRRMRC